MALLVQRYRIEEHHTVLHSSPLLKKTCVIKVVLDKWLPLSTTCFGAGPAGVGGAKGDGRLPEQLGDVLPIACGQAWSRTPWERLSHQHFGRERGRR